MFPYASAGAIFHAGIAIGKFHGVMTLTTPIGSRVTDTSMPGRTESSRCPLGCSTAPAKYLRICPARTTSPRASGSVLPSSRASRSPSSSARARTSLPALSSTVDRSHGVVRDHTGKAVAAASIAAFAAVASTPPYSRTTSERSDGLTSACASPPVTGAPPTTEVICRLIVTLLSTVVVDPGDPSHPAGGRTRQVPYGCSAARDGRPGHAGDGRVGG